MITEKILQRINSTPLGITYFHYDSKCSPDTAIAIYLAENVKKKKIILLSQSVARRSEIYKKTVSFLSYSFLDRLKNFLFGNKYKFKFSKKEIKFNTSSIKFLSFTPDAVRGHEADEVIIYFNTQTKQLNSIIESSTVFKKLIIISSY